MHKILSAPPRHGTKGDFSRNPVLRAIRFSFTVTVMLTAQTLIADAGLTALAKDLSEIAGRPCSPQQLNYWRRVNAVPGRWLPAVREYLRRQGTEPSADDVDALLGSPSVVDKINLKGGLRKGDNGAKATPRARKQQLCGGGA